MEEQIQKSNVIRIVRLEEVKKYSKEYFDNILMQLQKNAPEASDKKEVMEMVMVIQKAFISGLEVRFEK